MSFATADETVPYQQPEGYNNRCDRPIASLTVLGDERSTQRPQSLLTNRDRSYVAYLIAL